jgi:uncharacterized protein
MKIVVFFDGRPGHEKQSRGILAALQKLRTVDVVELPVRSLSLARTILDTARLFVFLDGGCRYDLPPADLLLGTGSRTHLALLSCKKKYGLPAVTCMAPDIHLRSRFDLCCVPQHDGIAAGENIFLTVGPPNVAEAAGEHDRHHGLILLGGIDEDSHIWSTDDILGNIEKIVRKEGEVHWHISSSPRTPQSTITDLIRLTKKIRNCTFFHYTDTGRGWIEEHYAKSGMVWVTADSMSMVYEALSAGCRVGSLPVSWKKTPNKFQRSEEYLLKNRYITTFALWEKGLVRWESSRLNEAERCAQEILRRWF